MRFRFNIFFLSNHYYVLSTADEDHRRDAIGATGPPQRAVEERGAGMPRRRRNLAFMVANRRPQRGAVELGTV